VQQQINTPFLEPFYTQSDHVSKAGSGQTHRTS
jgi:hypothetical protein